MTARRTSVTAGFNNLVTSIRRAGAPLDTAFDAREALGRALAKRLDDEKLEDKNVAGLAREYRAVLAELMAEVNTIDDDDSFGSALPAPLRHPEV